MGHRQKWYGGKWVIAKDGMAASPEKVGFIVNDGITQNWQKLHLDHRHRTQRIFNAS
jgi:hypothetical protein